MYFLSDGTCMLAAADCHPIPECPPGTPIRCEGKYPLILYKFTYVPYFFIIANIDFENKIFLSDGTCMLAAADCHPLPECPPGTPVRCGGKHPLILYKFTHVPDFFIIANIDFENKIFSFRWIMYACCF